MNGIQMSGGGDASDISAISNVDVIDGITSNG
jgi:hypothetical protein